MNTLEAIQARRAVKSYDPSYEMPVEDEKAILEAAMLAPTAFNIQNWRFVVVKDSEKRELIKQAAWGQAQVTDASLLIVLTADTQAWDNDPQRYWKNASEEVQTAIVPMIRNYYSGKESVQRDEAMRSCGMAGQNIMLAAKALGYDSCPMDGFDFEAVAKVIHLPDTHVISFMIVVGKATKEAYPRGGQLSLDEVVVTDSF